MTQAHKTPGALVRFKPITDNSAPHFEVYMGRVFEVVSEVAPGHFSLKDFATQEMVGSTYQGEFRAYGFHPEGLVSVPKAEVRQLRQPGRRPKR